MASRALPFVLSLIAGSTDIIGFLGLNGLFTAHITGNLVVLAAHIVVGDATIFSYILSVPGLHDGAVSDALVRRWTRASWGFDPPAVAAAAAVFSYCLPVDLRRSGSMARRQRNTRGR